MEDDPKERDDVGDQHWQAPDAGGAWTPPNTAESTAPAASPPSPSPAGYAPQGYPPGAAGYPGGYPAGAGAPAWAPPPKPGLIPLRPLGFGTLLWAPFRTLRRNPAPTFGSGLLVQLATLVASAAVVAPFAVVLFTRAGTAAGPEADAVLAGAVGGFLLLMLVPIAVSVVSSAFMQGVMVVEVATGSLGERLRFGELWRRTARRAWPLIGWTLLVSAALLVAVLLVAAIVAVAAVVGGPVGLFAGIGIAVFLGLALLVPGVWLGVKTSLVPSAIVLEQLGIRAAIVRSWRLTDGYFWRTFGVILLVGFIVNTAANIVAQPVSFLGSMLAVIIDPTGTGAGTGVIIGLGVLSIILSLLIGAVTLVVQAAVTALIYLDLRMRKEGLDLELERHVERRDAGLPVSDPYLVPAPPSA